MTYRGRVENGVVVVALPDRLPEGAEVEIVVPSPEPAGAQDTFTKYAGAAKNLPSDASRNLDHYLYGHPKR